MAEEVVPVEIIGKLTLNRLVNNFFAEEEQSSFDPATLVPGIEFSNDPVLPVGHSHIGILIITA